MTSLDNYRDEGGEVQKQTHITLVNTEHPEGSQTYTDDDTARQHFSAAKAIQSSGINRKAIVGDFLVAVEDEVIRGEEGSIEEFFEQLQE